MHRIENKLIVNKLFVCVAVQKLLVFCAMRDKIDGNAKANHTTKCIYTNSQIDACIHTCNVLHRYKPHHSKHTPLNDLGGPLLLVHVHCTVIMIGGNECQRTW